MSSSSSQVLGKDVQAGSVGEEKIDSATGSSFSLLMLKIYLVKNICDGLSFITNDVHIFYNIMHGLQDSVRMDCRENTYRRQKILRYQMHPVDRAFLVSEHYIDGERFLCLKSRR